MLARIGCVHWLPSTESIELPVDAAEQLLRAAGWNAVIAPPVVLVGNPSPLHKVIVFLCSPAGEPIGVAKFPLAPDSRHAILHEAEMLKTLGAHIKVPHLLHYSEETGCSIQEYLGGRVGERECRSSYVDILVRLASSGETLDLREELGQLMSNIARRAEFSQSTSLLEDLFRVMECKAVREFAKVPATIVHGDFAPWNIRELHDGNCTLVDWESTQPRGLPLHDLCHFFYIQTRLFTPQGSFFANLTSHKALAEYCEKIELDRQLVRPLSAAYLASTLLGHWQAGEAAFTAYCLNQIKDFLRR
jgi:aminoglycoside phosphotransferase (APT) family kinase protein